MAPSRRNKKKQNKTIVVGTQISPIQNIPRLVTPFPATIIPLLLDKPIPNLKTIPLSTPSDCKAVTTLLPPKPTVVNLVDSPQDDRSPHIPRIKTEVSNTNLPNNPIPAKTAARTVGDNSEEMAKKSKSARRRAAMLKQASAQGFVPGGTQAVMPGGTQAVMPGGTQAVKVVPIQAAPQATAPSITQATAPGIAQATAPVIAQGTIQAGNAKQKAGLLSVPGIAQGTIQAGNAKQKAGLLPVPGVAQGNIQAGNATQKAGLLPAPGIAQATAPVIAQGTIQAGNAKLKAGLLPNPPSQKKPYNNQQKKKWFKFMNKVFLKKEANRNVTPAVIPEEPPLPEMSQDGSPNVIAQASEPSPAVSTSGANQGTKIQKPNITLKTKKNLQETAMQRPNWIKPDANSAANKPGTSATPKDSSQVVEAPQAPESAGPIPAGPTTPGSTIPTLENRTVEPVPRSSAGSFFKKAPPAQQPPPQKVLKVDPFVYRYPKGVPRSFLLQQEKSLEAGGAPMSADSPIWPNIPNSSGTVHYQINAPTLVQPQPQPDMGDNIKTPPAPPPITVQTDTPVDIQQPYSPSDAYSEQGGNPEPPELDTESSDQNQSGQKRLSAFQRLGPVSQPKKPKLTINLNLKKDQPVREVVNDTDDDPDKYTPVHLRQDIVTSTDETVVKFLPTWPWRKNVTVRRSATARNSRSVMILEQEKMEEAYEKDNIFIQITVKGYPSTWTKERVLDAVLDSVKGYSFIPCFTEFYQHECKFLVLRSRSALIVLHKTGFYIHKDGVELALTISIPMLGDQLHFIPRIILRKRMILAQMDKKLNLSAFTMQNDISHFIYFPLNRLTNQTDCIQLQSAGDWEKLVEIDLSHNRLTTISGFELASMTPNLKHLDLSHNCLDKVTVLLNDRKLPLKTIRLEANPLCHDYIDPDHYVKVIRMMFPAVVEIDGVPIRRKDELPNHKQNYCPEEAQEVSEKFLEIFFPLLDSGPDHRSMIQGMYDEDASLTITYCYKLRYGQIYRNFRNLFLYARFLDEGETDSVVGAMAITKLINRWPHTEHDPFTFTVDSLYHSEKTTILRIGGVLKLTAETLADDEHLLSFTRTIVLHSEDGVEYKIHNEMVYWYEPSASAARAAFRVNTISQKNFNLKIEATTDEDLRDKFLKIFMKLTTMDKKICERCLEVNNWNFKLALEHFTKLLKLNNLDSLTYEIPVQPSG